MKNVHFIIKSIAGQSLKGIAEEWILHWPRVINNKPQATIILGDNGSGKSSIVALIEFCLQGRNGSWLNKTAKGTHALLNVTSQRECYAQIVTGDGKKYRRTVSGNEPRTPNPFLPFLGFEISPFVLRRYDIVRFIEQSPESRQVVLWEYLSKGKVAHNENSREVKAKENEEQILEVKNELSKAYDRISRRCETSISQIPENPNQLRDFLKAFTGFPSDSSNRKVDWGLISLFNKVLKHRKTLKELRRRKSSLLGKASLLTSLNPDVQKALTDASRWITDAFLSNATIEIVNSVEIKLADMKSLDIRLVLKDEARTRVDPYLLLSEANIDLLALLFYLALIRESAKRGQEKIICLDDIFQSVDKVIRLRVLDLVASEFGGWEVIITTHDRSWAEAIKASFVSHRVPTYQLELERFDPVKGPVISSYQGSLLEQLEIAVSRSDTLSIRGLAGVALEECCNKLSMSIGSSIKRKPGDKYTLGDLWPSIHKQLKLTSLAPACRKLDASLFLRNYVVAHYNESAIDVSDAELVEFGVDVATFIGSVTCRECGTHIMTKQGMLMCRCGKLVV
jgi:energy-coupling factor transporter ATP-binding protein EcfA2